MFSQYLVEGLLLRCTATVGGSFGLGMGEGHAAHGCKTGTSDDARVSSAQLQPSLWSMAPTCASD